MIARYGSEWGGFKIDMDLVMPGSTAICAGIGNDITFDLELIRQKNCHIVGLDPTFRAIEHISGQRVKGTITEANYTFIPRALYGMSGEKLRCQSFRSIFRGGGEESLSITLPELLSTYPNTSLVKMDVEGAEFPIIYALESLNVPQICLEFHHRLLEVPYETPDAEKCIAKMKDFGYEMPICENDMQDCLFIRKDLYHA